MTASSERATISDGPFSGSMLSNGTYISWFPHKTGRDFGFCGWGNIANSYNAKPILPIDIGHDTADEGGAPISIYIGGLDETAIQEYWTAISTDPSATWSSATNNCSTVVAGALAAGGASTSVLSWYQVQPWQPTYIQTLANNITATYNPPPPVDSSLPGYPGEQNSNYGF